MSGTGYSNLRKGRYSAAGQIYHVVSRTHQRQKIFSDWALAAAASRAFTSDKALVDSRLLCWVLMPDHAHWLLELGDISTISALIGRMKSLSAREVRITSDRGGSIWHPGYYERAMRREDDLVAVARYIIANPLRANLCSSLRYYPFWNAVYF